MTNKASPGRVEVMSGSKPAVVLTQQTKTKMEKRD